MFYSCIGIVREITVLLGYAFAGYGTNLMVEWLINGQAVEDEVSQLTFFEVYFCTSFRWMVDVMVIVFKV